MKSLTLIASLAMCASMTMAAKVGEACSAHDDCVASGDSANRIFCNIPSPSCGGGECQCTHPFSYHAESDTCVQVSGIGGPCNDKSNCADPAADCVNEKCACSGNYVQGPRKNDCIHKQAKVPFGEQCYDSIECFYDLKCFDNTCTCPKGYKKSGEYECVKKGPGDECSTNEDCLGVANTECSGGACSCVAGTEAVSYVNADGKMEQTCQQGGSDGLAGEGENCVKAVPTSGEGKVCKSPFLCEKCGGEDLVCVRKVQKAEENNACRATSKVAAFMAMAAAVAQL